MIKEYQLIKRNDVQDAVLRLEGKSVVSSIWIFKIQHAVDGNIVGYNEIFVAQGFSRKEGIDYKETFAPETCQVYVEQPLGIETHDQKTHVCKLNKDLYELRKNPWDRTYSYIRSLNITQSDEDINLFYNIEDESLQRMTSSQMGVRRTFEKVQDGGSWYPVTLDGYIEYQQQRKLLVTLVHNVSICRV